MNQKELLEAKEAVERALTNIGDIKKPMGDAKMWSWLDIMGNGIIGSYLKRQKIKEINSNVSMLQNNLKVAVAELKDINLDVDLRISDNGTDDLLDVWFDNIFTDARVHNELKSLKINLEALEAQLRHILSVINREEVQ